MSARVTHDILRDGSLELRHKHKRNGQVPLSYMLEGKFREFERVNCQNSRVFQTDRVSSHSVRDTRHGARPKYRANVHVTYTLNKGFASNYNLFFV